MVKHISDIIGRMSHSRFRSLAVFIFATLFVSCSQKKPSESEALLDTETIWTRENPPQTLDWNLARTPEDQQIAALIMEGLTRLRPTETGFEVENLLAEQIEAISSTRWRITLRSRKWSNGTPLTANHFIQAWKYHLTHLPRGLPSPLDTIAGVPAFRNGHLPFERCAISSQSDQQLEVNLGQIDREFPIKLSFPQTWPRTPGSFSPSVPTLGPFRLVEFAPHQFVRLERDPGNLSSRDRRGRLKIEWAPSAAERVDRFVSGESQIADAPLLTPILTGTLAKQFRSAPGAEVLGLLFVADDRPWSDVHLRRALFSSLSFDELYRLTGPELLPLENLFVSGTRSKTADPKPLFALLKGKPRTRLGVCAEASPIAERTARALAAQWNTLEPLEVSVNEGDCQLKVVRATGRGVATSPLLASLLLVTKAVSWFPALATRLAQLSDTPNPEVARARLGDLDRWLTQEHAIFLSLGAPARGLLVSSRIGEIPRSPLDFWDLRDTTF